jgi:hypothetical protein
MTISERVIPIGTLELPALRGADFLETLAQWGELPDIVVLPELAALLARTCKQNEQALLKILGDAVWSHQIPFWGLSDQGAWSEGMLRCLVQLHDLPKPRVRLKSDGTSTVTGEIPMPDRKALLYEAMGIAPASAVALLVKRGRKIPPELLELLPEQKQPAHAEPIGSITQSGPKQPDAGWQATARRYAYEAWRDRVKGTNPSKDKLSRAVSQRFAAEGIQGPRGPLSASTIAREALNAWTKPSG